MDINRNHYFMIGVVMLLLGVQLRCVDSYLLNDKASEIVVKRFKKQSPPAEPAVSTQMLLAATTSQPPARQTIKPPVWIGWSFVSIGAVLILHSLAMKKPG